MRIERIFTVPVAGGPQLAHDRVTLVAAAGIAGDRFFGRQDEPGQNLSLVEAEVIESFLSTRQRVHDLSITRRNLVTRGVRLNELVGRLFYVGDVLLRGVELCEPCFNLGSALAVPELPAAAVVRHFVRRAGLRADVLSNGVVAIGADVRSAT